MLSCSARSNDAAEAAGAAVMAESGDEEISGSATSQYTPRTRGGTAGGLTDCGCRNQTCEETDKRGKKSKMWYCESVKGIQLALDPYAVGRGGTY